MSSQVEICNYAIAHVGGNLINSLPDGNKPESNLCQLFFEQSLRECLGDHNWKFAKKWDSLASAVYTFTDDQYDYAYALPGDFIRFSDQENRGPGDIKFVRRGQYLLCNETVFEIEYIYYHTTYEQYPEYFVAALSRKLAFYINPDLMKKGAKQVDHQQAYMVALDKAKLRNAQEDNEDSDRVRRHSDSSDTWINARG